MTDPDINLAVRAGCQWANARIAALGVQYAKMHCGYPLCSCEVVPGQIKAAIEAHHDSAMKRWREEMARTREPDIDPSPETKNVLT